jgi:DNA polymerase III subunit delta
MPASAAVVHPVYAVIGQDRFLRNEALQNIMRTLTPQMDALGPACVDGKNTSLADLLDEVRTPSLLGGRRVVIVDDADDCITANREKLEKYCADPALGGCLIFLCDSMPKNTRIRKIISGGGEVIECEPLKGRAVVSWIVRRAKEVHGKRVNDTAAQMLKDHLGDALGLLDVELAKLAAYVGDRPEITPKDIDSATGEHREEKVFAVLDAITTGDPVSALRAWEQVWTTDRAAPGRAIAGLAWSVRRLLEVRREWERGADIGGLARRMFTDPVTLRRRLERSSVDQLREQQRDLLAADIAAKTGLSTVEVAVERFIVKHSTRSMTARSKTE